MAVSSKNNDPAGNTKIITSRSRTIKNKLPVTWIGKLVLEEDALVIFNCSATNTQKDGNSLATSVSLVVDSAHSSHNTIPALEVDDPENPPRCSINFTIFLEKGEHRFEVKGTTSGKSKEPSVGELNYDYCAVAVEQTMKTAAPKKATAKKKVTKGKTTGKKKTKKKTKAAGTKKTAKKKAGKKAKKKTR